MNRVLAGKERQIFRKPALGQKAQNQMYSHVVGSKMQNLKDTPILNPMFTNPDLHEARRIEDGEKLP